MPRITALAGCLLVCVCAFINAGTAPPPPVVDALLDRRAPPRDWRSDPNTGLKPGEMPSADAPSDVLLAFWVSQANEPQALQPSQAVRRRLVDAALADPVNLPDVLTLLPTDQATADRIRSKYDQAGPAMGQQWREGVHEWLVFNDAQSRPELIRRAATTRTDKDGLVDDEPLKTLALVDWSDAEPILNRARGGGEPHLAALALCLIWQHEREAADPKAQQDRESLKHIVEDHAAPPSSRDRALRALMGASWDGRDEWFVSLFSDAGLRFMDEGIYRYEPLQSCVARAPEHWIPRLTKLIKDRRDAVHDTAASCLLQFSRVDAITPLLPWVANPDWSACGGRLGLIQSLAEVELPQSIPDLIWVVDHEPDNVQTAAVEALAHYKASQAGPAVRHAFIATPPSQGLRTWAAALVACDAIRDSEVLAAIEARALTDAGLPVNEPGSESKRAHNLSLIWQDPDLGAALAEIVKSDEKVAAALLERARKLDGTSPASAAAIRKLVWTWPSRCIDEDLARRVEAAPPDEAALAAAAARAGRLSANARDLLDSVASHSDEAAAASAAILGDQPKCHAVLDGQVNSSRRMLLAIARLARTPLPVAEVAPLLRSDDHGLAGAAEEFLVSEDTPESRAAVLKVHSRDVLILGASNDFPPDTENKDGEWSELESVLRAELRRPDGPDQIFALLSSGGFGNHGQRIVRLRNGSADLEFISPEGVKSRRPISAAEWRDMGDFITSHRADALPPLPWANVMDGVWYEYLHLDRSGGIRVYMNNPQTAAPASTFDLLARHWLRLNP